MKMIMLLLLFVCMCFTKESALYNDVGKKIANAWYNI